MPVSFFGKPLKCKSSPGEGCHCGYNAWFDMDSSLAYSSNHIGMGTVFGVIAGSGIVEMHSKGFRSENAQILAFYSPNWQFDAITKATSSKFNKPFFSDPEKLITWVSEYGVFAEQLKTFPDLSDPEARNKYRSSWRGGVWPLDGLEDECSYEDEKGGKYWFQGGLLHRDGDKPAVERENGSREWYQQGLLHRDRDQPAFIDQHGTKAYYKRGVPHRKSGPAVESGQDEQWIINGQLHRTDGPAEIRVCEKEDSPDRSIKSHPEKNEREVKPLLVPEHASFSKTGVHKKSISDNQKQLGKKKAV